MHDKFFYKPNSEPQWAEERQFDTVEAFHKYANTAGNKFIHFLAETFCMKTCFDGQSLTCRKFLDGEQKQNFIFQEKSFVKQGLNGKQ